MPKIKTNSGAKKRFKLTGTGKMKTGLVHKSDTYNVKHMLGLK